MKTRLIALFIVALCITDTNAQSNLTLWYKSPAKAWEEALPVGNGRMGAMILEIHRKREYNSMRTLFIVESRKLLKT